MTNNTLSTPSLPLLPPLEQELWLCLLTFLPCLALRGKLAVTDTEFSNWRSKGQKQKQKFSREKQWAENELYLQQGFGIRETRHTGQGRLITSHRKKLLFLSSISQRVPQHWEVTLLFSFFTTRANETTKASLSWIPTKSLWGLPTSIPTHYHHPNPGPVPLLTIH